MSCYHLSDIVKFTLLLKTSKKPTAININSFVNYLNISCTNILWLFCGLLSSSVLSSHAWDSSCCSYITSVLFLDLSKYYVNFNIQRWIQKKSRPCGKSEISWFCSDFKKIFPDIGNVWNFTFVNPQLLPGLNRPLISSSLSIQKKS